MLEDDYWTLIRAGVGTGGCLSPAGDRADNGVLLARLARRAAPHGAARTHRSGRFLSLLERERVAVLREQGCGVRDIASRLGLVGDPGAVVMERPDPTE